jgi:tripartite-type tricarboxylate transporter receptor subunit TctC
MKLLPAPRRLVFAVAAGLASPGLVLAQPAAQPAWPVKPIRMIVPYPPGGPTDIMGRLTAEVLTRRLGETVVIDNRGGAATSIGAELAARAAPDGYTLFVSSETTFAVTPSLNPKLSWDPERDFTPISLLTTQPYVLGTGLSLPAASVAKLIEYAKANPGKLSYGSAGNGSGNHLAGELFKQAAGIDMLHVPYKGNGPAIADLIGGQISLMLGSISSIQPHAASKKLRVIAVASAKRAPGAPDVPTFTESGLPGFQVSGWNAIVAPRGAPAAVVKRINAEINAGFAEPEVMDRLRKQSIEPFTGTPEQLSAHIRAERARFSKLVQAAGLKAE